MSKPGSIDHFQEPGVHLSNIHHFPELPIGEEFTNWIKAVLGQESRTLGSVSIVFLTDDELLELNREHLQHDTYTDIITFVYRDDPVDAEIYVSADRVRENAGEFGVSVFDECVRVIAHGLLHACGWTDHPESAASLMRNREDACLVLYGVTPKHYVLSFS